MLDQEIASAMKFIIEKSGNPAPYYYEVPQDFLVPAVYFPSPEVDTTGDTLATYALEFMWFVKFFHEDTGLAYDMGFSVLNALQSRKNVIPLIDQNGELTGRGFRMRDPRLKPLDHASQLTLLWTSPREYFTDVYEKMVTAELNIFYKNAVQIIEGG